ncbi:MAG: GLPGLI family protein [Mucilaginibacter sp.]
MKNRIFFLFSFLLIAVNGFSQNTHFTVSGTIAFEKKVNMYALIKKLSSGGNEAIYDQAFDLYKKSQPQFKTLKSTLSFANGKMLFKPEQDDSPTGIFGNIPTATQNNIIYTDLESGVNITQKKVFDETFLLKDSIRNIKWKITDETSEISGYTCRRANGLVMDSIYVVAFYTTEIPVSGGPESFSGLPGMILKVALPHENVIWTATSVTDTSLPANTVIPPKKGKPTNYKDLITTLRSVMKNWGVEGQSYLRAFLL